MPVAGDDAQARQKVIALATLIGFDAVDLGELSAARYIEPWAMVWIEFAMRLGHGRKFGFVYKARPGGTRGRRRSAQIDLTRASRGVPARTYGLPG